MAPVKKMNQKKIEMNEGRLVRCLLRWFPSETMVAWIGVMLMGLVRSGFIQGQFRRLNEWEPVTVWMNWGKHRN